MMKCSECRWLRTSMCPVIYDYTYQATPQLIYCAYFEENNGLGGSTNGKRSQKVKRRI